MNTLKIKILNKINKLIIYKKERWYILGIFYLIFLIKCIFFNSFFALLYILSFYYLQNAILYITPNDVPSIHDEEDDEEIYDIPDSILNKQEGPDGKPIIRKLSEFNLWKRLIILTILTFILSFNKTFNIPVIWPLLVFYFIFIIIIIYFKQKTHMKKYKYNISDFFKKR